MTKSGGRSLIDAIEAGEVDVRLIGVPSPVISVKYALANSTTGVRFGSGFMNVGWSENTQQKFKAFIEAIEADVCGTVFEDGATIPSGEATLLDTTDGIPSL